MNEDNKSIAAVPQALAERLSVFPRIAVAFSGGVDSSYLLYAAVSCGIDVQAYYISSQFQPQFELADAQRLTSTLGIDIKVIPVDIFAGQEIASNPPDRCYYCKYMIFKTLKSCAAADGYDIITDGTNASDSPDGRPGMRALTELNIISPLRDTGMTKAQVREHSRRAGLFTHDKPAYSCLATRIPAGTAITEEMLKNVENAETALAQMGFSDFRARISGTAVRLQLPEAQIPLAVSRRGELLKTLSVWFDDVLLDLKPR